MPRTRSWRPARRDARYPARRSSPPSHEKPTPNEAASTQLEAAVAQAVDVVRQADREQDQHQQESDGARPFHDAEWDSLASDLLHEAPEDVPAVEGQEREQVDDGERQADQSHQEERLHRPELKGLLGDGGDPDDPVDFPALLHLEAFRADAERAP